MVICLPVGSKLHQSEKHCSIARKNLSRSKERGCVYVFCERVRVRVRARCVCMCVWYCCVRTLTAAIGIGALLVLRWRGLGCT